jgi:hypothetical protein
MHIVYIESNKKQSNNSISLNLDVNESSSEDGDSSLDQNLQDDFNTNSILSKCINGSP